MCVCVCVCVCVGSFCSLCSRGDNVLEVVVPRKFLRIERDTSALDKSWGWLVYMPLCKWTNQRFRIREHKHVMRSTISSTGNILACTSRFNPLAGCDAQSLRKASAQWQPAGMRGHTYAMLSQPTCASEDASLISKNSRITLTIPTCRYAALCTVRIAVVQPR